MVPLDKVDMLVGLYRTLDKSLKAGTSHDGPIVFTVTFLDKPIFTYIWPVQAFPRILAFLGGKL
jgi:hypothetical protein